MVSPVGYVIVNTTCITLCAIYSLIVVNMAKQLWHEAPAALIALGATPIGKYRRI